MIADAIKTRGPLQGLEYMTPRTAQMTRTASGILIGSATVPRQRIHHTRDAVRIQAAMIDKPRGQDYYSGVEMWVCACAVAVMAFMGWLPGGVA
jgi:hypothetical protein